VSTEGKKCVESDTKRRAEFRLVHLNQADTVIPDWNFPCFLSHLMKVEVTLACSRS